MYLVKMFRLLFGKPMTRHGVRIALHNGTTNAQIVAQRCGDTNSDLLIHRPPRFISDTQRSRDKVHTGGTILRGTWPVRHPLGMISVIGEIHRSPRAIPAVVATLTFKTHLQTRMTRTTIVAVEYPLIARNHLVQGGGRVAT